MALMRHVLSAVHSLGESNESSIKQIVGYVQNSPGASLIRGGRVLPHVKRALDLAQKDGLIDIVHGKYILPPEKTPIGLNACIFGTLFGKKQEKPPVSKKQEERCRLKSPEKKTTDKRSLRLPSPAIQSKRRRSTSKKDQRSTMKKCKLIAKKGKRGSSMKGRRNRPISKSSKSRKCHLHSTNRKHKKKSRLHTTGSKGKSGELSTCRLIIKSGAKVKERYEKSKGSASGKSVKINLRRKIAGARGRKNASKLLTERNIHGNIKSLKHNRGKSTEHVTRGKSSRCKSKENESFKGGKRKNKSGKSSQSRHVNKEKSTCRLFSGIRIKKQKSKMCKSSRHRSKSTKHGVSKSASGDRIKGSRNMSTSRKSSVTIVNARKLYSGNSIKKSRSRSSSIKSPTHSGKTRDSNICKLVRKSEKQKRHTSKKSVRRRRSKNERANETSSWSRKRKSVDRRRSKSRHSRIRISRMRARRKSVRHNFRRIKSCESRQSISSRRRSSQCKSKRRRVNGCEKKKSRRHEKSKRSKFSSRRRCRSRERAEEKRKDSNTRKRVKSSRRRNKIKSCVILRKVNFYEQERDKSEERSRSPDSGNGRKRRHLSKQSSEDTNYTSSPIIVSTCVVNNISGKRKRFEDSDVGVAKKQRRRGKNSKCDSSSNNVENSDSKDKEKTSDKNHKALHIPRTRTRRLKKSKRSDRESHTKSYEERKYNKNVSDGKCHHRKSREEECEVYRDGPSYNNTECDKKEGHLETFKKKLIHGNSNKESYKETELTEKSSGSKERKEQKCQLGPLEMIVIMDECLIPSTSAASNQVKEISRQDTA